MLFAKIKIAVGMILFATFLTAGAMTWARQEGMKNPAVPSTAINTALPIPKTQETPPPKPEPTRRVMRTVRGIIRDEQGRPVVKAWVGERVEPMRDLWMPITSPDRIRAAKATYHDPKGHVIPPGPLGKYFEYRDDSGNWQPVHPDDIRRRSRNYIVLPDQLADAEKRQPDGLLEVRLAKGRQWMIPLNYPDPTAARTDAQGHFAVNVAFLLPRHPAKEIRFASPDFLREAVHVFRADGPDRPLEITLKLTRIVRARVVETPKDDPDKRVRLGHLLG